jgi:hypothetical protein
MQFLAFRKTILPIFSVKYSRYPEDGGNMLLRNIDNYSPIDTSYHHFNLHNTIVRALNLANKDLIGRSEPQINARPAAQYKPQRWWTAVECRTWRLRVNISDGVRSACGVPTVIWSDVGRKWDENNTRSTQHHQMFSLDTCLYTCPTQLLGLCPLVVFWTRSFVES